MTLKIVVLSTILLSSCCHSMVKHEQEDEDALDDHEGSGDGMPGESPADSEGEEGDEVQQLSKGKDGIHESLRDGPNSSPAGTFREKTKQNKTKKQNKTNKQTLMTKLRREEWVVCN